jgi:hypothetical protein
VFWLIIGCLAVAAGLWLASFATAQSGWRIGEFWISQTLALFSAGAVTGAGVLPLSVRMVRELLRPVLALAFTLLLLGIGCAAGYALYRFLA